MRRMAVGSLIAMALAVAITAQSAVTAPAAGVHPISGRRFAPVMGWQGAGWLDRPERAVEESPDLAVALLKIPRGATVADIGAGSGYMTTRLAGRVGPTGRVYANDVQPQMVDMLRRRFAGKEWTQVTVVQGEIDDPKLPSASVDLALLVDVYHELSRPQAMLRHLREALRPGGRLVLVEYRKEDPNIPIQAEHKMSVRDAKLEVEAEGFILSNVDESLPRQHLLTFTPAPVH